MKEKIIMNIKRLFAISLCFCLLFGGAQVADAENRTYSSLEDLNRKGIKIGVQTGTTMDIKVEEFFPEAEVVYFNSYPDMAFQVTSGGIDSFAGPEPVVMQMEKSIPEITHLKSYLEHTDMAFVFPKTQKGKALSEDMSVFIDQLKADGTLDEIFQAWVSDDRDAQVTDLKGLTGENGTLDLALESAYDPFCFIRDGQPVGIDMDVIIRYCQDRGFNLVLHDMIFDAVIPSLGTLADFGTSGIEITEERKEEVYFSSPYYSGGNVMVVAKTKLGDLKQPGAVTIGSDANYVESKQNLFTSIRDSFEKTFIRENRWKLIIQGIGTTVLISVCAAIVGTMLGFGICMMKRSLNLILRSIASVYIRILQGTPMVVLLMILFYIVFAKSNLPGVFVAIVGFALNFAAYVSEIMRTGIEAVDKGQMEAALALGYTKTQAFFQIVMPQAARNFLPVYNGELVSLVKSTSVVGYIAVQDLTKMSDIIRSRTYEAFFPLIATAIIYFLIAGVLSWLLKLVQKHIEPNRQHRTVKGVELK